MSEDRTVAESIAALLGSGQEPESNPMPGDLEVVIASAVDSTSVRAAVEEFEPKGGWVCYTDEVSWWDPSESTFPRDRTVLSGEWYRDAASLDIRRIGDKWQVRTCRRVESREALIVTETFLGVSLPPDLKHSLRYEVAWRQSSVTGEGFRPAVSRLVGIDCWETSA